MENNEQIWNNKLWAEMWEKLVTISNKHSLFNYHGLCVLAERFENGNSDFRKDADINKIYIDAGIFRKSKEGYEMNYYLLIDGKNSNFKTDINFAVIEKYFKKTQFRL